jgi:hypothetical protein
MTNGPTDGADAAFLNWLAGFIDGEGSFTIRNHPSGGYLPRFRIKIRSDDAPIVYEIQARTGIGRVAIERGADRNSLVVWSVESGADMAALLRLLDAHPLRAKKARDFQIWREAVREYRSPAPRASRMEELKRALEATRVFLGPVVAMPADEQAQMAMGEAA